jgi:uncharacterized protein YbjT (DUF2867 family)
LNWCNNRRSHSTLGNITPAKYENNYYAEMNGPNNIGVANRTAAWQPGRFRILCKTTCNSDYDKDGIEMKVFQIGASGNVGTRLSSILTNRGDEVSGMHRSPDQASGIAATGARPVLGDLIESTEDELAAMMTGHDAVVFSAGAHGTGREMTTLIDGEGLRKSAVAAATAGVQRFVLVSVFPESGRAGDLGDDFDHYMRVKKTADVVLANTDLDWVIVRPGRLTVEQGTGLVFAGLAQENGDVSRDNVAAFIAAALAEPALSRVIVELTDGPEPINEAVSRLSIG